MTLTVCVPAVFNAKVAVAVPLVNETGLVIMAAIGSVLVTTAVPEYPIAVLPLASSAVMVIESAT